MLQLSGSWELDFFGKNRAALDAALGAANARRRPTPKPRACCWPATWPAAIQWARLQDQLAVAERTLAQREETLQAGARPRLRRPRHPPRTAPERRRPARSAPADRGAARADRARAACARRAGRPARAPRGAGAARARRLQADGAAADASRPTCWAAAPTSPPRAGASRPRRRTSRTPRPSSIPTSTWSPSPASRASASASCSSRAASSGAWARPIRLPIFEGGRLRANLRGKTADLDAAIESYNAAVLDAVRDVADQVASVQSVARQQAQQREAPGRRRRRLRDRRAALQRRPRHLPQRADGRDHRAGAAPRGRRPRGARARRPGRPRARAGRRLAAGRATAGAAAVRIPEQTPRQIERHTASHDNNTAARRRQSPRRNDKRRRASPRSPPSWRVAGAGWGAYEWLVASHYEIDRQRLRAGQRDPDHAADRRHRDGHHGRRHRLRESRPAAGAARSGRCAAWRSTRPRPRWRRRCARCARSTPTTARWPRRSRCARPTSSRRRATSRARRTTCSAARPLSGNGAVSKEELNHAETALANAKSALAAAQAGVVARARAARQQPVADRRHQRRAAPAACWPPPPRCARPSWRRSASRMPAPVDGYVAKRTVQLGQRVAAGTPMMSIVPLNQVWVDANFKEVQLRNIRLGQPVKLTADVYGKKVEYSGTGRRPGRRHRRRLRAAAGAERHRQLDQGGAARAGAHRARRRRSSRPHPLRVGLSMDAEIDVTQQGRQDAGRCAARQRAGADPGLQRSSTRAPTPKCSASSPPTWARRCARRRGQAPARRRPHRLAAHGQPDLTRAARARWPTAPLPPHPRRRSKARPASGARSRCPPPPS